MSKNLNYDEKSIQSLEWNEHIRVRPGMYIGKLGDGSHPDDGIYVSLRLIELLSKKEESISQLLSVIQKYISTTEIRLDCIDDTQKFLIVKNVKSYFINNFDCNL